MLRRFFRTRHAAFPIQMPAHILEPVFHLDRPIAVQPVAHDAIIADRIIAIQAKARDVHSERVSRRCSLNVEGTSLGIAAQHACNAFFICAACIHRGAVNRVSRRNGKHRFIFR